MNDVDVDEFLSHHGVKGMHWGVRKEDEASGTPMSSKKKKIIIGASAGTALVVGMAATAVVLRNNGKLPVASIQNAIRTGTTKTRTAAQTAQRGQQAVKFMAEQDIFKKQMAEFETMLKKSNNDLYKNMVNDAARAGVPTISRQEFDDIRG